MSCNNFFENTENKSSDNPFMEEREFIIAPMECIPQEKVISNVRLAHAYVPMQHLCTTYTPEIGLHKGTIFPELFSPYMKGEEKKCRHEKKCHHMDMEEM